jgi:hypothetical protein
VALEERANVLLGGVEGEVPYVDRRHPITRFFEEPAPGNATPGRRGK